MELLRQVREGRYTGTRKVFSDLCQIIKTNTIDRYRRKKSRDRILDAVGRGLEDTETGKRWRETSAAERLEIQRLIRQAVASIPGRKQRLVMEAYVANFPESHGDLQKLREFTSALSGTEETVITVKRALQEGRAKVRAVLSSKGYNVDVVGEDDE
jgi:adenylosuccinate synthase